MWKKNGNGSVYRDVTGSTHDRHSSARRTWWFSAIIASVAFIGTTQNATACWRHTEMKEYTGSSSPSWTGTRASMWITVDATGRYASGNGSGSSAGTELLKSLTKSGLIRRVSKHPCAGQGEVEWGGSLKAEAYGYPKQGKSSAYSKAFLSVSLAADGVVKTEPFVIAVVDAASTKDRLASLSLGWNPGTSGGPGLGFNIDITQSKGHLEAEADALAPIATGYVCCDIFEVIWTSSATIKLGVDGSWLFGWAKAKADCFAKENVWLWYLKTCPPPGG